MSLIEKYVAFVKRWEGGLSRIPEDSASKFPCPTPYDGKKGWHTNRGITYAVWKSVYGSDNDHRFYAMNVDDWWNVFKTLYWDSMRGDEFKSQNVSIFVTGMAWGSGKKQATKSLQRAIANCGKVIDQDGILGNQTIRLANECDPRQLFDALTTERERFFRAIAKPNSKNAKFLKGWLNRLEDYKKTFRP